MCTPLSTHSCRKCLSQRCPTCPTCRPHPPRVTSPRHSPTAIITPRTRWLPPQASPSPPRVSPPKKKGPDACRYARLDAPHRVTSRRANLVLLPPTIHAIHTARRAWTGRSPLREPVVRERERGGGAPRGRRRARLLLRIPLRRLIHAHHGGGLRRHPRHPRHAPAQP